MKVQVLGPLVVSGARLSPRERTALAAFAVRRGRFVNVDELADAIWGDGVPATWRKQTQIAVSRLRRALGVGRIETKGSSYLLRLAADELDVVLFEETLGVAREHAASGDHDRAAATFARALELWRGPAFEDVASWPPGADASAQLDEIRRTAEEELLQARLDSGLHRTVVPEAQALAREDPTRERRWAMLATALYRSDRQEAALQVLREARRRLVEEHGLEPGRELTDLETAILRHDGSLDLVSEPVPPRTECPYRGLGAFDVADAEVFFGRSGAADAALDGLAAARLVVLTGPSGCGKSSLARAGVLPRLGSHGTSVAVLTPGEGGLAALLPALTRVLPGVVLMDQFEEIFAGGLARAELDGFGASLVEFVDRGGSLLITVRSDFLDQCSTMAGLGARLSKCLQFVTPMSETQLRASIEEPARLAGLRIEPGLAELLLRDVRGEPAALPHMSHALVETWVRREGRTLTVAGYEEAGGISGAIAQSAEALYQGMDAAQRQL